MNFSRREFLSRSLVGAGLFAGHNFFGALAEAAKEQQAKSPFLAENFGPVREEITADNLKVIGRLPGELDGMYVRNGPNPQFPPKLNYHWFDGDGMLHGATRSAAERAEAMSSSLLSELRASAIQVWVRRAER